MEFLQDAYFSNLNAICHLGGYFSIDIGAEWHSSVQVFNQNKFYCVTEGGCCLEIDGQRYEAEPGDWFFIPVGARHSFRNDSSRPFSKYWMHFVIYPNESLFRRLNLPCKVHIEAASAAMALFAEFAEVNNSTRLTEKLRVKSILFSLLTEYIQCAHRDSVEVHSCENARLNDLLLYIHEHVQQPLTVEELAGRMSMHPNHFIRYFKKQVGITPGNYVKRQLPNRWEQRMSAAFRGSLSIFMPCHRARIACSFKNQIFKRGMTIVTQHHTSSQNHPICYIGRYQASEVFSKHENAL